MYKIKNVVYADAGKILIKNNQIGHYFIGQLDDFTERDINLDNLHFDEKYLYYDVLIEKYTHINDYSKLKTYLINKRFSNDDLIAIILNKDNSEEDLLLYNKMQEYRNWISILSKKILSLNNN